MVVTHAMDLTPKLPDFLAQNDILDALRSCFHTHPSVSQPLNIVDLGLVESISLLPDPNAPGTGIPGVPHRQSLELVLLSPSDDEVSTSVLLMQIHNRFAGVPQISRTSIRLVSDPQWTPDLISSSGRRLLNLDPTPFPILNNVPR